MKRLKLNINRHLKGIMLACAIIGGTYAFAPVKAATSMAFTIGLVAGMKKKGVEFTPEEEKIAQSIEDELNEGLKGLMPALKAAHAEDIEKLASVDDLAKLKASMKEIGTKMAVLELGKESQKDQGYKTIREQLHDYFANEDNKKKYEQFKSGEIKALQLELKAADTMLISNATGQPNSYIPVPEIQSGLVDLVRNQPFMMNYFNVGNTNRARIVWTEKTNPEGTAQFIGEGEVKPLIDFNIVTRSTEAKKVADKIKTSTEMLDDIDFMAAEIENELRYQVEIAVDAQLLSGDGLNDNLKGITEYIGGYVLTSIETETPNRTDAIRAAIAQVVSLNFRPNRFFINPIDAANMDLQKDGEGRYLIPPFQTADGMSIGGVRGVETNQIPAGSVMVVDTTRFKIRVYKPFSVYYGWVNDDFEKNLVTVIGEMRLHTFMPENHTGAGVYDTFANIQSAITAEQV